MSLRPGKRSLFRIQADPPNEKARLLDPEEWENLTVNTGKDVSSINWQGILTVGYILFMIVLFVGAVLGITAFGLHLGYDHSRIQNLNVTGNFTALKAVIESIMGGNVSIGGNLTVEQHALITHVWASHVNATEMTSNSLTVEQLAVIESLLGQHVEATHISAQDINATHVLVHELNATQIKTDMLSFVPLSVTTNIVLPASHNTFHLSHASTGLNVTLPTDLTPMIGKRIKVCNADGKQHTLIATPHFWDSGNLWSRIRFQNGATCCVDFTVLTASVVTVESGISNKCALLCEGFLCVDPSDPEGSNPLIGKWLKRQVQDTGENVIDIHLSGNELKMFRYVGTPYNNFIREINRWDRSFVTVGDEPQNEETLILEAEHTFLSTHSPLWGPAVFYRFHSFTWQGPDADTLVRSSDVDGIGSTFSYSRILPGDGIDIYRTNTSNIHNPVRGGTYGQTYAVNSLKNQFIEMTTQYLTTGNPQMSNELNTLSFAGELAVQNIINTALNQGFGSFNGSIIDVYPSFRKCNVASCGSRAHSTTIFVDSYIRPSLYAQVTISGFGTGSDVNSPYTVLNGVHRVVTGGEEQGEVFDPISEYLNTHYKKADHRRHFGINLDTFFIKTAGRIYSPLIDGTATVRVDFFPITETMSPGDFYATLHQTFQQMTKRSTHTSISVFTMPSGSPFSTFPAMYSSVASGQYIIETASLRRTNGCMSGGSSSTGFRLSCTNDKYESPSNSIHVPSNNYLSEKYNIYLSPDPNTPSSPSDLSGNLVSLFGFPNNGSRFMFTYAPVGSLPTFPFPGAPQAASGTIWRRVQGQLSRAIIFGRVNPALTNGTNTAYIFIPDSVQPPGYVNRGTFSPNGTFGYPNLKESFGYYGPSIQMWAVVFQKLMSYNTTKLIIDSRANLGGAPLPLQALGMFIGGERNCSRTVFSKTIGYGNSPGVFNTEWTLSGANYGPDSDNISPEKHLSFCYSNSTKIKEIFGSNVMFQGSGKELIFLNSIRSASAGDFFPWNFIGNDPMSPRNLGEGVTVKFVGDIDGVLYGGGSDYPLAPRISSESLLEISGSKSPITWMYHEWGTIWQRLPYPPIVNQHPAFAPDLLLSGWFGETKWPDTGVITPHPDAPLSGWTAQGRIQEVTLISTPSAGIINNSGYFTIDTTTTSYYVWYNIDSIGVNPNVPGKTGIMVSLLSTDTDAIVAIKTVNAMGPIQRWFLEFQTTTSFTARNKIAGLVSQSVEISSNVTISQVQASASNVIGQVLTSNTSTWRDRWLEKALLL